MGAQKKSLLEKMALERKPGGKMTVEKSLVCFEKHGIKPGFSFFLNISRLMMK